MAQTKFRPRLYTLMFCVAVFSLTSVGLAALSYGVLPSSFFLIFILFYAMAWALLFAGAVDFFGGKVKFGGKKVLVLTFVVMLASALFTHVVWTIATPSWSYSVSTDRSTYILGESVTITASLRNMGFITHSFRSASSNPVCVRVTYLQRYMGFYVDTYGVWYSADISVTEFSVEPGETLERNLTWNQTRNIYTGGVIELGSYRIHAFIPSDSRGGLVGLSLFSASTIINITST